MKTQITEARREYLKKYNRIWRARRRSEWIKEHGPCSCGSTDRLEVDHIDPAIKLAEPSSVWGWTKARRDVELEKCQVLCHSCHKEKTRVYLSSAPMRHGVRGTYHKRGCRCEPCTKANADYKREWRNRRRAANLPYT